MKTVERLGAIVWKEWLQVFRDPSALMIAFVLPAILLFIFGFGLSLDVTDVKTGVVLEDASPLARSFYNSLDASKYIEVKFYAERTEAELAMRDEIIRAVVVVPNDFTQRISQGEIGVVQILTDGGDTNLAFIVENYLRAAFMKWTSLRLRETGEGGLAGKIDLETKTMYNPAQITRHSLIPGSIAMILAIIGTLLTALVVAREWERGTMEATLAASVGKFEMFVGKFIPYFLLGLAAAIGGLFLSKLLFDVPFRGSFAAYLLSSSVFLLVATTQGIFISSICRDQSVASQVAVLSGFLPNFILSGAIFEIDAMPKIIQLVTYIFPARYYVVCLQTIFMAGDVWLLLLTQIGYMCVIGAVVVCAAILKTPKRL